VVIHFNLPQYQQLAEDLESARDSGDWSAIDQQWHRFKDSKEPAQLFLAQAHGFATWPNLAVHLEALAQNGSPVARYEAAADAIVNGDVSALRTLLAANPGLVSARSSRAHKSTLLHYVSANGVEDERQNTPANIVEIAELLLDAGADVNAESNAYGGRSTALNLTATSAHPERAGVQIPLLTLLLQHGATIRDGDVNACLANGRGHAAEFLAPQGAPLDLEGAAGLGRLDLVESFFPFAPQQQRLDGFGWACEFGRTAVVEFFLQNGMDVAAKLRPFGQTGLHWAAYSGHPDIVKLLLDRGSSIHAKDDTYSGTPLGWALHAWGDAPRESHYEVAASLAQAGAEVDPRDTAIVKSNARMWALLRDRIAHTEETI
jgi:ankyrin repeat protein